MVPKAKDVANSFPHNKRLLSVDGKPAAAAGLWFVSCRTGDDVMLVDIFRPDQSARKETRIKASIKLSFKVSLPSVR